MYFLTFDGSFMEKHRLLVYLFNTDQFSVGMTCANSNGWSMRVFMIKRYNLSTINIWDPGQNITSVVYYNTRSFTLNVYVEFPIDVCSFEF